MSTQPEDSKEYNVSLAKAMKIRKALRILANTVKERMLRLPAFAQSDMVATYTRKLTTADARSEYEFIMKVLLSKMAVDLAIEKVNAEGQNLLAQIATLRECRDFANKITTNFQTSDNVERTWNSVTGVNDITKLEPVLCDLGDEIKTADKRIAELEDTLSEFNAKTRVSFSLYPEVVKAAGI